MALQAPATQLPFQEWWRRANEVLEPESFLRLHEGTGQPCNEPCLTGLVVVVVPQGYLTQVRRLQKRYPSLYLAQSHTAPSSASTAPVYLDEKELPSWSCWHGAAVTRQLGTACGRRTHNDIAASSALQDTLQGAWSQRLGPVEFCRIIGATFHQLQLPVQTADAEEEEHSCKKAKLKGSSKQAKLKGLFVRLALQRLVLKEASHPAGVTWAPDGKTQQGFSPLKPTAYTCNIDYHLDGQAPFVVKRSYFSARLDVRPLMRMFWEEDPGKGNYYLCHLQSLRVTPYSPPSLAHGQEQDPAAVLPSWVPGGKNNRHAWVSPWHSVRVRWEDSEAGSGSDSGGDESEWVSPWELQEAWDLQGVAPARRPPQNQWLGKLQPEDWLLDPDAATQQQKNLCSNIGREKDQWACVQQLLELEGTLCKAGAGWAPPIAGHKRPDTHSPQNKQHKRRRTIHSPASAQNGESSHQALSGGSQRSGSNVCLTGSAHSPFCATCHESGDLIYCTGPCGKGMHLSCAGLPSPASSSQAWRCSECVHGSHTCVVCGRGQLRDGEQVFQCSYHVPCGRFYHSSCLQRLVKLGLPVGNAADPSNFTCPAHFCSKCGKPAGDSTALRTCWRCPRAYHMQPGCLHPDARAIEGDEHFCECHSCRYIYGLEWALQRQAARRFAGIQAPQPTAESLAHRRAQLCLEGLLDSQKWQQAKKAFMAGQARAQNKRPRDATDGGPAQGVARTTSTPAQGISKQTSELGVSHIEVLDELLALPGTAPILHNYQLDVGFPEVFEEADVDVGQAAASVGGTLTPQQSLACAPAPKQPQPAESVVLQQQTRAMPTQTLHGSPIPDFRAGGRVLVSDGGFSADDGASSRPASPHTAPAREPTPNSAVPMNVGAAAAAAAAATAAPQVARDSEQLARAAGTTAVAMQAQASKPPEPVPAPLPVQSAAGNGTNATASAPASVAATPAGTAAPKALGALPAGTAVPKALEARPLGTDAHRVLGTVSTGMQRVPAQVGTEIAAVGNTAFPTWLVTAPPQPAAPVTEGNLSAGTTSTPVEACGAAGKTSNGIIQPPATAAAAAGSGSSVASEVLQALPQPAQNELFKAMMASLQAKGINRQQIAQTLLSEGMHLHLVSMLAHMLVNREHKQALQHMLVTADTHTKQQVTEQLQLLRQVADQLEVSKKTPGYQLQQADLVQFVQLLEVLQAATKQQSMGYGERQQGEQDKAAMQTAAMMLSTSMHNGISSTAPPKPTDQTGVAGLLSVKVLGVEGVLASSMPMQVLGDSGVAAGPCAAAATVPLAPAAPAVSPAAGRTATVDKGPAAGRTATDAKGPAAGRTATDDKGPAAGRTATDDKGPGAEASCKLNAAIQPSGGNGLGNGSMHPLLGQPQARADAHVGPSPHPQLQQVEVASGAMVKMEQQQQQQQQQRVEVVMILSDSEEDDYVEIVDSD